MAQTESILRLLVKDDKSPSGWKPVGYLWYTSSIGHDNIMRIYYCRKLLSRGYNWLDKPFPSYGGDVWEDVQIDSSGVGSNWGENQAFEQGIKMPDGSYWFEGDIGKERGCPQFELCFNGIRWTKIYRVNKTEIVRTIVSIESLEVAKRLGNIHDKGAE